MTHLVSINYRIQSCYHLGQDNGFVQIGDIVGEAAMQVTANANGFFTLHKDVEPPEMGAAWVCPQAYFEILGEIW